MSALRVLVCDDEMIARKRVARLLGAMSDVEVVGECEDGAELGASVEKTAPHVVILDINMPNLSGIDAAALLGDDGPAVVFCTAHAEHAVDAFALGACDYVLKPVDAARLHKALQRVRGRVQIERTQAPLLPRLAIPTRRGVVLVDPVDVTHATLEEELVTVWVDGADKQSLITDFALSDLEDRLPADRFVRVHRKALVNLAAVVRLDPVETGGYVARMKGGHDVIVSRAAARELRRRLGLREA